MIKVAIIEVETGTIERRSGLKAGEMADILTRIGAPAKEENGKLVVEVTPNRPDLFSVEGLMRAVLCWKGRKAPKYKVNKAGYRLIVGEGVGAIRPFVRCGVVKGVKIDGETIKDIMQMQEKLHDTVGRRRRKVAIGIHDLDGIKFPLEYVVGKDERFVPLDMDAEMGLDEVLREHPKGVAYAGLARHGKVVIKDREGVISFPPIINSERTRVTESTTNLLLDVTGTSREAVEGVLNMISASFADAGGKVYSVEVGGAHYPDLSYRRMEYEWEEANGVLGLELSRKEIAGALMRMGYFVKGGGVFVPPYRVDIISRIDITEDVAIGFGYENFVPELPPLPSTGALCGAEEAFHSAMCGMGFLEAKNYVLSNEWLLEGTGDSGRAKIENSGSEEFTMVRTSLLPGLLATCRANKTKGLPQKFYEIGCVWNGKEETRLAFLMIGNGITLTAAQSVLQTLGKEAGMGFGMEAGTDERFISGRCYSIISGRKWLGVIGEISPKVLEKFGLEYPVAACEIILSS